jgi:hypothetical protein
VIVFLTIAALSTITNYVNPIDAVFVTLLRIVPLFSLIFAYHFSKTAKSFTKKSETYIHIILVVYLVLSLIVGGYQYFVNGAVVDFLISIQGNAHAFSYIAVFLSLFLLIISSNSKTRLVALLLHIFALYMAIKADYKLGILAYLIALPSAYVLVFKSKYVFVGGVIGVFLLAIIIFNLKLIIDLVPFEYSIVLKMLIDSNTWDLKEAFPPDMELFKGYWQLVTEVLDNTHELVFGVGPGNYASNIALAKGKPLATEYVIYYREILESQDVVYGTLLNRFNSMINLIAEYGLLGSLVYLYIFIRLIFHYLRRFLNNKSTYKSKYIWFLTVMSVYIIIQLPILGTIEEAIYISSFLLTLLYIKKSRDKISNSKRIKLAKVNR